MAPGQPGVARLAAAGALFGGADRGARGSQPLSAEGAGRPGDYRRRGDRGGGRRAAGTGARGVDGRGRRWSLTGSGVACISPTALGLAGSRFGEYSGSVFGLLSAMGLTGGLTLPWARGHLAAATGLRPALFSVGA
jgi:hypothetical protein